MDYYDNKHRPPGWLSDHLWENAGWTNQRLEDITPLYVARFRGRRLGQPLDAHAFWEITGVTRGSGHTIGEQQKLPLEMGTLTLIPPGVKHAEASDDPALDTIWLGFQGAMMSKDPEPRLTVVTAQPLVDELERLWLFANRGHGGIGPELDGKTLSLVGQLMRLLKEEKMGQAIAGIDKAINYLHDHHAEQIAIPDLARLAGFSLGHFQRIFKQRTGRSPVLYLMEVRLKHAADLLSKTGMSVNRAAELVGFSDPFYFSRCFKKLFGRSPNACRSIQRRRKIETTTAAKKQTTQGH